jgi:hypothetical protein
MVHTLRAWTIKFLDGKADETLVERWTAIPDRRGFIYFFDSERLKRSDGISVFLCNGSENRENRFDECEKIAGKTAHQLGIFTSREVITVHP